VAEPISRVDQELDLLRRNFPHLEYLEGGHWVRIHKFDIPDSIWDRNCVEVCFQIPEQVPGQAPYGFYARPNLNLKSGQPIGNYAYPAPTGFGGDWGKFSWQLLVWAPTADLVSGTNMVNFVRSFVDRFAEGA
jgi:hypothetical protein